MLIQLWLKDKEEIFFLNCHTLWGKNLNEPLKTKLTHQLSHFPQKGPKMIGAFSYVKCTKLFSKRFSETLLSPKAAVIPVLNRLSLDHAFQEKISKNLSHILDFRFIYSCRK